MQDESFTSEYFDIWSEFYTKKAISNIKYNVYITSVQCL